MEIMSKSAVLLVFLHVYLPSYTYMLARVKHFCNILYLPVDTHSYMYVYYVHVYAHRLYYLRKQCVAKIPCGGVYIL